MNTEARTLKNKLLKNIQLAVELELSTIPPYLTALYSIRPGTNIEAAGIIRSVLMEEMLHMVMAANTLSALGGRVRLSRYTIPNYPVSMDFEGKFNRKFEVNLEPLSLESLDTFLQIELPEYLSTGSELQRDDFKVPGNSVGGFYQQIIEDLDKVSRLAPAKEIFSGDFANQVSEQYYWGAGGKPIVVTDLSSAKAAIALIVEQGEGLTIESDVLIFDRKELLPHYYRFKELRTGKRFNSGDHRLLPTGDIPLTLELEQIIPLKHNPKHADYRNFEDIRHESALFNLNYAMMLGQLEEGFNGNPQAFYGAIVNCMKNMSAAAGRLVQMPISGKQHAAPTFEWPGNGKKKYKPG